MKIVTLGLSPYLGTARAKLNSWILQYLMLNNNSVASIVSGHDTNYFYPIIENNQDRFYFNFNYKDQQHRIPLFPHLNSDITISTYEYLEQLKPDLVITIGDATDFAYIKAIKTMTSTPFKWLFVLTQYYYPVNEAYHELLHDADAILCVNQTSGDEISTICGPEKVRFCYVGCNRAYYKYCDEPKTGALACVKNTQSDNLPTILEACANAKKQLSNFNLKLFCNVYERGDYNFDTLQHRFDPNSQFLKLPDQSVSIYDFPTDLKWSDILRNTELYISIPMTSSTAMSVFQSLCCGCVPILPNYGINKEIASLIEKHTNKDILTEDILVSSNKFMSAHESYLYAPNIENLGEKIIEMSEKLTRNKGLGTKISQLVKQFNHGSFLAVVKQMVNEAYRASDRVRLEPV